MIWFKSIAFTPMQQISTQQDSLHSQLTTNTKNSNFSSLIGVQDQRITETSDPGDMENDTMADSESQTLAWFPFEKSESWSQILPMKADSLMKLGNLAEACERSLCKWSSSSLSDSGPRAEVGVDGAREIGDRSGFDDFFPLEGIAFSASLMGLGFWGFYRERERGERGFLQVLFRCRSLTS